MNPTQDACYRADVRRGAREALAAPPRPITDFPAPMSEGGLHDYYSNGDYWWPNPDTADGLPYVRRDGESNPDNFQSHRLCVETLNSAVADLAAAYRLTGDESYAAAAVRYLRTFFLDDAKRMNPALPYAQAIPGVCPGRGIGIIDTIHLTDVPFAVRALQSSPAMDEATLKGLTGWFAAYLKWLMTHPYGVAERQERNNHSVGWYMQAAVFAWFTGSSEVLALCRRQLKETLLPRQMAADGSFPLELARTKPYNYSVFVLELMAALCRVLSTPADNLWNFALPDGRGIRLGMEFLYPYLRDKSSWPYARDVQHFDEPPVRLSMMLFAAEGLSDEKYEALWRSLPLVPGSREARRNCIVRRPELWITGPKEQ